MAIIGINGRINSGKDTLGSMIQYFTDVHPYWKALDFEQWCIHFPNHLGRGSSWQIKKFAGKLKEIASIMTGIPIEKFEDQEFKKTELGSEWQLPQGSGIADQLRHMLIKNRPYTVREFLQHLGTDAIRNGLHPNAWVNALFADYKSSLQFTGKYQYLGNHKSSMGHDENYTKTYPNWIITDVRFPNEAQAIKDRGGVVIRIERPEPNVIRGSAFRREGETDIIPVKPHISETALDEWPFDVEITNDGTLDDLLRQAKELLNHLNIPYGQSV